MNNWENFKIFMKYIFNPKGFIEGARQEIRKAFEPKRLSIIILLFAFYYLIRVPFPDGQRTAAILLFIALIVNLIPTYRGGEHRAWYKKKQGIVNAKEIKNVEKEGENV